jgi:hypothetical protein
MIPLRMFASSSRRVKPHCQKLLALISKRLNRLETDCSLILDNFEKNIRLARGGVREKPFPTLDFRYILAAAIARGL